MTGRNLLRIAAPIFSLSLVGCFLFYKSSEVKDKQLFEGSKSGRVTSTPSLLPGSKSDVMVRPENAPGPSAPGRMLFPPSKAAVLVPLPTQPAPHADEPKTWIFHEGRWIATTPPTSQPTTSPATRPAGTN